MNPKVKQLYESILQGKDVDEEEEEEPIEMEKISSGRGRKRKPDETFL